MGPIISVVIFQVSLYDKAPHGTVTKFVDYAGVLIFKCPDQQVGLIIINNLLFCTHGLRYSAELQQTCRWSWLLLLCFSVAISTGSSTKI